MINISKYGFLILLSLITDRHMLHMTCFFTSSCVSIYVFCVSVFYSEFLLHFEILELNETCTIYIILLLDYVLVVPDWGVKC